MNSSPAKRRSPAVAATIAALAIVATPASAAPTGSALSGPGAAIQRVPAMTAAAFPGVVVLDVDATDVTHKVFRIRQQIPLSGSKAITLLYPQWQAASHAPSGQVGRVAGLTVQAHGQPVRWTRDASQPHAFHLQPPKGATVLDVEFRYLSPRGGNRALGRHIVNVGWSNLLLYPAGYERDKIWVSASVTLPDGLHPATSLPTVAAPEGRVRIAPVRLSALMDAPLLAGRHWREEAVSTRPDQPVQLHVFANDPADLATSADRAEAFRRSIAQVQLLFGERARPPFHVLMALDERMGGPGGIEHRHATELFLPDDYLRSPQSNLRNLDLALHEYIHSWNGTQFVPADMRAHNYNEPLQNSLLWVYEGLTQYLGKVTAARGGMRTLEEALDDLAIDAALAQTQASHRWKSLRDSVHDPVTLSGKGIEWSDFTGKKNYYGDGALLWLAVDVEIRTRSGGRKSLDDFVRLFFSAPTRGVDDTRFYTEAEVHQALQQVVPGDWKRFLDARLDALDADLLLTGLARAGYRLVYSDSPSITFAQDARDRGVEDHLFSLGLAVDASGAVRAVQWDGPAFRAGLAPGAKLRQVNGAPFSVDGLKAAVGAARPVRLRVDQDGSSIELEVASPGLRYPRLERVEAGAVLDEIFRAR
ncbi:hypothetical protein [Roseateles amylovorans]|uniref:M61 family peptidase n=1 Tax=Roseateles amylovorans TaxID=2978473 RepID=A0ABY6B228_9BURK|nr:hypothetical protein [Roseateles amylovorans]UXH78261.1 hypothetical protein N4261_25490 [Roseateles amylovorans]